MDDESANRADGAVRADDDRAEAPPPVPPAAAQVGFKPEVGAIRLRAVLFAADLAILLALAADGEERKRLGDAFALMRERGGKKAGRRQASVASWPIKRTLSAAPRSWR